MTRLLWRDVEALLLDRPWTVVDRSGVEWVPVHRVPEGERVEPRHLALSPAEEHALGAQLLAANRARLLVGCGLCLGLASEPLVGHADLPEVCPRLGYYSVRTVPGAIGAVWALHWHGSKRNLVGDPLLAQAGEFVVPGLPEDPRLRWDALVALAASLGEIAVKLSRSSQDARGDA